MAGSPVPVAAWVGPSKSTARGAAAGSSSRPCQRRLHQIQPPPDLSPPPGPQATGTFDCSPAARAPSPGTRLSGRAAAQAKVVDFEAPTLGDLLVGLDGRTVPTAHGPVKLSAAKMIKTDDGPRRTANQPVRFSSWALLPACSTP